LILILLVILFSMLLSNTYYENTEIDIIYFRNDNCRIAMNTDSIINEAIEAFGDKINVRIINAKLDESDPEDTEEVKQLREMYHVIGLPDLIINGKKFGKEFTRDNIFNEMCNNFIVKPGACL